MNYIIVWAISCAVGAGLMHTVQVHIADTAAEERAVKQDESVRRFFNYEPLKTQGNRRFRAVPEPERK